MSFDALLQDVIQKEVARALGPFTAVIEQLRAQGAVTARLASVLGAPMPAAPKRVALVPAAKPGRKPKAVSEVAAAVDGAPRGCAIEGCGRPARSKGYCAAHYQKFRMLQKTGRLPEGWVEFAPEGSVQNVTLPRGRAGAKALAKVKGKG